MIESLPRLWVPPLTHFTTEGAIDHARMRAHLTHLSRWATGWLVPGSTGEGWEMEQDRQEAALDLAIDVAADTKCWLLAGMLRTDLSSIKAGIHRLLERVTKRTNCDSPSEAMHACRLLGVTVCPPKGASLRDDEQMEQQLDEILQMGVPTALYQLPQITENEFSPRVAAALAKRHSNFFLLKDTSGYDRVALSRVDLGDVFLVRGAEGDYLRWLKSNGGPYDGFLLSTANCFASQYAHMIQLVDQGQLSPARELIEPIESVVAEVFSLVSSLEFGNPFTNANKAIDHFMAFGKQAMQVDAPRTCKAIPIPESILAGTRALLEQFQLLPDRGYLSGW